MIIYFIYLMNQGNSLASQWLGICSLIVKGLGSTSGWGTKIPQDMQ